MSDTPLFCDLVKGKKYALGTIRKRKDGSYKKTARGWVKVVEDKPAKKKAAKKAPKKKSSAKKRPVAKKKAAKKRPSRRQNQEAVKRIMQAIAGKKTKQKPAKQLRGRALRRIEMGPGLKPGESHETRAKKHIRSAASHKNKAEKLLAMGADTVARSHRKAAEAHLAAAYRHRGVNDLFHELEARRASEFAQGASLATRDEERHFKRTKKQRQSWAASMKSSAFGLPSLQKAMSKQAMAGLDKIVGELNKASQMHASQASRIEAILKKEGNNEKLAEIVGELKKASKMHAGQAKRIAAIAKKKDKVSKAEEMAKRHPETDFVLPMKTPKVLQAEDKMVRGLIATSGGNGLYDIQYWYEKPNNIVPVEVKVDGRTVTERAQTITIAYHTPKKPKEA